VTRYAIEQGGDDALTPLPYTCSRHHSACPYAHILRHPGDRPVRKTAAPALLLPAERIALAVWGRATAAREFLLPLPKEFWA